jgi:hypothetical protein
MNPSPGAATESGRQRERRRRPFWKRRRFWVVVIATLVGIVLVFWAISNLGVQSDPD